MLYGYSCFYNLQSIHGIGRTRKLYNTIFIRVQTEYITESINIFCFDTYLDVYSAISRNNREMVKNGGKGFDHFHLALMQGVGPHLLCRETEDGSAYQARL